jgi:hypothetical protein
MRFVEHRGLPQCGLQTELEPKEMMRRDSCSHCEFVWRWSDMRLHACWDKLSGGFVVDKIHRVQRLASMWFANGVGAKGDEKRFLFPL